MLLSNVFSDMFDDMFPTTNTRAAQGNGMMSCDVKEFADHYELDMELAGYRKEDIKAELKDGYLTIKAERHSDNTQSDSQGRVVRSERFMGTCQRTFYVGDHVQRQDVSAAYEDGVLKLQIPKKVEQPKVEERNYIDIQ
ncbi:MAG: Hsp20/alpha crystallin family protein [Candidatus Ventricola sp.]